MDRVLLEKTLRLLKAIEKDLDEQCTAASATQHHHRNGDAHDLLLRAWAKVQDATVLVGNTLKESEPEAKFSNRR